MVKISVKWNLIVNLNLISFCSTLGDSNDRKPCIGDEIPKVRAAVRISERIVRGRIVKRGDIPYQISLRYLNEHLCGGILYNKDTVLTAAHCIAGDQSDYLVVAGDFDLESRDEGQQERAICNWVVHENFIISLFLNDIAVVKVCAPFRFSAVIQPIGAISHKNGQGHDGNATAETNNFLQVTGWGRISERGKKSRFLRAVMIPPQRPKNCRDYFCDKRFYNPGAMLCAGATNEDACEGDSGGPLVRLPYDSDLQRLPKHHVLVGLVSWGIGCGRFGIPGVYTNIQNYSDWILVNSAVTATTRSISIALYCSSIAAIPWSLLFSFFNYIQHFEQKRLQASF